LWPSSSRTSSPFEGVDEGQQEEQDAHRFGRLVTVLRDYADRVLPVDAKAAEEWGRMNVPDPISIVDGLMAATAKVRNMTFVTRNTSDVARTGVRLLNPFDASE
jgi:predicted nucleic acid-binding protein